MKKKNSPGLTREKIIDAAYTYADSHGIDSLSMRTLADLVNVKAMSLYNHVKNKDDVIDALVDKVVSEIKLPDPEKNWKEEVKKLAVSTHKVLLQHRWITPPLVSRMNIGPAKLTYYERSLAILNKAGFSLPEADSALNAIESFVFGFTLIKLNFPIDEADFAEAAQEGQTLLPRNLYPAMHDLSQMVMNGTYDGIQDFNFGLDFILSGLEKNLLREKRSQK